MRRSLLPMLVAALGGLAVSCGDNGANPATAPRTEPPPTSKPAAVSVEVSPADLPPAVAAAVRALFPKVEFESAVRESGDTGTRYTVTLTSRDGVAHDVTVSDIGTVIEVAKEIRFKELPRPVAEQVRQRYLRAEIGEVAELTTPGADGKRYHVELKTANGTAVALTFEPDGKLVEVE